MLSLLLLVALVAPVEAVPCPNTFANPPRWPSFTFMQMDAEALRELTITRNGKPAVDLPEGAIVLGSVGTSMPGGTVLRAWVYTREDKSVSSYLLHGDALARLYSAVIEWLKEHPRPKPIPDDVPKLRVSR